MASGAPPATGGSRPAPLDGVLVLDLSRILAGPFATMLLGDLGARIVKIEEPGTGDPTRGWGPPFVDGDAAYFHAFNRNKESVTADLATDDGRRLVAAIARRADVAVSNFPPETARKLGVSPEALESANPRLVVATITGFGGRGPEGEVPGFDFLVQAMSGWMSLTGRPGDPPTKTGLPLVDLMAGLHLEAGILAALRRRDATGRGERVEVSLLGAASLALGHVGVGTLATGVPPVRHGNGHPTIVPYAPFDGSDAPFALAVGTDRQWGRLAIEVLGRPELATDPRYATNAGRVTRRAEVEAILAAVFATAPAADWVARCRAAGVPAGPIRDLPGHFASAQAAALGLAGSFRQDEGRPVPCLAPALELGDDGSAPRRPPPRLGDRTDDVRREFLGE